jgi:arginyl-tRNA synthetase
VRLQRRQSFLNLEIADAEWLKVLHNAAGAARHGSGVKVPGVPRRVVVEYRRPTPTSHLHLGHLRNNFLGYAVAGNLESAPVPPLPLKPIW